MDTADTITKSGAGASGSQTGPASRQAGRDDRNEMSGAEMVVRALADNGVKHPFGYPGGAVLPIYDEHFQQEEVEDILVRHEPGAGHAAGGSARARSEEPPTA